MSCLKLLCSKPSSKSPCGSTSTADKLEYGAHKTCLLANIQATVLLRVRITRIIKRIRRNVEIKASPRDHAYIDIPALSSGSFLKPFQV